MATRKSSFDWTRIELEYLAGEDSIREIADRHAISEGAIRKRAKAEKWVRVVRRVRKVRTSTPPQPSPTVEREREPVGSSDREDAYLAILIAAAVRAIEGATGCDFVNDLSATALRDRAVAAQAALLLVGQWYANCEAAGQNLTELPLAITFLIAPLRKFVV